MPGVVHPSADACQAISTRLSNIQELRLPAALLREHPYPEPAAVQQHLQELLLRDAAVFLERYGALLSADELSSFEPLRDNYEVDYYLKQAAAAAQQHSAQPQQQNGMSHQQQQQQQQEQQPAAAGRQHLTSTVKNRRLAFMRRLEQQGEYFSEHAMREREPLVWQECIGRHEGHPAPPAGAPAGDRGFAGSLLASYDEAMLRARLLEQLEEEEAAMSEHDSEDSDDAAAEPQQQQQQQGLGLQQQGQVVLQQQQQQQQQDAVNGLDKEQQQQQQQQSLAAPSAAARPTAISTPAAASAGRTEAARAGAQTARAGAAEQQQQQPQQQEPAAGVDMGPEAVARRRHDFLVEMQHRFLDGLDGDQDYAAIDSDLTLDDDLAKEQAQDAEDAYFDAD